MMELMMAHPLQCFGALGIVAALLLISLDTTHIALASPASGACCCFTSVPPQQPDDDNSDQNVMAKLKDISRRDLFLLGTGGVAYGKLVGDAVSRVARGNAYPAEHEERVRSTFRTAMVEAAIAAERREGGGGQQQQQQQKRPLRVLEVGAGSECRVANRGLYNAALDQLILLSSGGGADKFPSSVISGVELVGVDLKIPKADSITSAREVLSHPKGCILPSFRVTFDVTAGDLMSGLPYPDGSFDSVLCALTLCSVEDQERSIQEIRRLVQPNGGTFGFVEHVAVRLDEEGEAVKGLLEWQQRVLDPLQQLVADNCHLHRNTDVEIWKTFNVGSDQDARLLHRERFFVNDMWPLYLCSDMTAGYRKVSCCPYYFDPTMNGDGESANDSFAEMEAKEESLRRLNEEIDSQLKQVESSYKPVFASEGTLLVPPDNRSTSQPADSLPKDSILDEYPPMGSKATIRLQKAKIDALSSQVRSTIKAKQELENQVALISAKLRDETKEKHRLNKALSQAKNATSKSKPKSNACGDTIESLRSELQAVKKELDSRQKSLKQADVEQRTRQLRLERALHEVNKYKNSVSETSNRNSKVNNATVQSKERDELQKKVRNLERQRSELLVALKKQLTYIDALKRQKVHAEAAKLLSFTEEAFVKEIGWGGVRSTTSIGSADVAS